MDIRKVKKLIELLEESNINEIEIKEGEESVRISRGSSVAPMVHAAPVMAAPGSGSSTCCCTSGRSCAGSTCWTHC